MGQKLTIYDFAKIMNAPDDLDVWDICHSNLDQSTGIESIRFKWDWQGYSGYGEIFLKNGRIDSEDEHCNNSSLTISSASLKQADKHYSVLYNEKSLI